MTTSHQIEVERIARNILSGAVEHFDCVDATHHEPWPIDAVQCVARHIETALTQRERETAERCLEIVSQRCGCDMNGGCDMCRDALALIRQAFGIK